jgi:Tol biopolymer transport system component/imidazolonepropionase-like amidohydrolase
MALVFATTWVGIGAVLFDDRPLSMDAGEAIRQSTAESEPWDVTKARGQTREIDFLTKEGTWMSADLSPDGRWVVFDLLAHIYRVPIDGGAAECLTEGSGVAVNFHPRYSPDGRLVAFISDRQGQDNLWVMNADGSQPRPVFVDKDVRAFEPAWSPDGRSLFVRRQEMKRGEGGSGIWMYSVDGGQGVEIVGRDVHGADWPAVSPDGRFLYFQMSTASPGTWSGRADVMQGAKQIRRLELRTGRTLEVTSGESLQQYQGSSGGAIAPEVSPDGRWLTFGRRIPDGTISYKGRRFGPRTALWLRDLQSGAERVVMDPIEVDMAEGMKVTRDLPGYSWARDSRSIVIAQGGKLRHLDVASGQVSTIPFTAHVHRTISEMAYSPLDVGDGPMPVKFPRWATASPDGRRLAFQAVGRAWLMDLPNGSPHRVTPDSFGPLEMSPAWSPDGRWLAFTSWDDEHLGHVWKIAASGGEPQRLTPEPGEYLNPVWSPDGQQLVVTRGSGATLRGRTVSNNLWYELCRLPAGGGVVTPIVTVNRPYNGGRPLMPRRPIVQATFGPDGRIYYPETSGPTKDQRSDFTEFASVRPDGSDRRVHVIFPFVDEASISPTGRWLAFQEGDNTYVLPFPLMGSGAAPVHIDKRKGALPVTAISATGGNFPHWRDATTLEYVSGPRYLTYDAETKKADVTPIVMSVPRPIPAGSIALTGARVITLDQRKVIERGTVVVKAGRISCVGTCDTAGVDRVLDVKGKTIIPGFVDMHAHHHRDHEGVLPRRNWESAIYVAYGVTTTLDISMWSENVFPTAEMIEAGVTIGPRTFSSGDPLYSGDAERQNEISSYRVAEDNVDRLVSWGAVTMKQYMQPRRDQRQWISDIARKRKLRVTAEGGDLEYDLGMIMDGQTGWEHPLSYAPLYGDAAKFFGLAHASYSPTFIVGGAAAWNEEYFYQESDVWKDEKLRRFTPWRMLIPGTRRRILRPVTDYSYPMIAQGLADIIADGGYGSIGSHGQQHGLGSHWEVWAAATALGPMGALEVASLHGAHFLGAQKDIGSIETGKLGDLMVLNKNPLDNIRNTKDISYVMKAGVLYDATTLDEVWPTQKPFGSYYWVNADVLRSDDRPVDFWDKAVGGESLIAPQRRPNE